MPRGVRTSKRESVERERQRPGPDVGGGVDRVGDRTPRRGDQVRAAPIVDVDDAHGALRQDLEEAALGGEVRLHVAVEVEVIARQVGEDAGGKPQAVGAAQRQRVRRHLHHAGAAAFGQHAAQHLLQLGRLGRRARARRARARRSR